jgi:hypothetical protein
MKRKQSQAPARRRGVILLVVLALLTLFAIVGISFVLYANAQANNSRLAREAAAPSQADMDPEMLLAYFLNQFIYDKGNDGVFSALRGHSLSRSMYGYNDLINSTPVNINNVPFNGTGRLRNTATLPGTFAGAKIGPAQEGIDDYHLINHSYFLSSTGAAVDGMVHDPERPGWYALGGTQSPWLGGFNAPYTYPDLNSMFLAAVKADGTVLMPSFHRHWLFNYDNSSGTATPYNFSDSTNPNWTNAYGKYLLLRPRPNEMGTGFPFPEDDGGDLKNLLGSPGSYVKDAATGSFKYVNNDSVWLDLGAPIMTAPDGTKFKALFAPLAMDLDNRLNVNVHGNIKGIDTNGNTYHVSNQGWGPWEVNLSLVLSDSNAATEWVNLFKGTTGPNQYGRYGPLGYPTDSAGNATAPSGTYPHFYGRVDFDGIQNNSATPNAPSVGVLLPGQAGNPLPLYYSFPFFPDVVQGTLNSPSIGPPAPTTAPYSIAATSPNSYGDGQDFERLQHPLLFNFFNPEVAAAGTNFNRIFALSNMEALLRYGDTGSPGLTSDLFRLCPTNFGDSANAAASYRRRGLVTTHSFDMDLPGVTPWFWNDKQIGGGGTYSYTLAPTGSFPTAPAIPFPVLTTDFTQTTTNTAGEFGTGNFTTNDWRALDALLGRVDLNRYLPPYPILPPDLASGTPITNTATGSNYDLAEKARQQFAADIFTVLVNVTGANRTATLASSANEYYADRWLAQLAANIVDFIDSDDIMTPFYWQSPNGSSVSGTYTDVVFGTELPRVSLNEAYAEITNDPTDPFTGGVATKPYWVNCWVELHNPFTQEIADPTNPNWPLQTETISENGSARLQMPAVGMTSPTFPVYALAIATGQNTGVRAQSNFLGDPDNNHTQVILTDWATGTSGNGGTNLVILPGNQKYNGTSPTTTPPYGNNDAFYVVGPNNNTTYPSGFPASGTPNPPVPMPTLQATNQPGLATPAQFGTYTSSMYCTAPLTTVLAGPNYYAFFLRRLACPYLPPTPAGVTAGQPGYNPYITVDYMDYVVANDAVQMDTGGGHTPPMIQNRTAWGRNQPFAAYSSALIAGSPDPNSQLLIQRPLVGGVALSGQPQHTFFRHNAVEPPPTPASFSANNTLKTPFDWLVHLDRQLISPMELLNVSGFRPWELTQQFYYPVTNTSGLTRVLPFQHLAPWSNRNFPTGTSARIYRALELFETHNRAYGATPGGRVAGKININTMWDGEPFLAICDPQNANQFSTAFATAYNSPGTGLSQAQLAIYNPSPVAPQTSSLFQDLYTSRTTSGFGMPPSQGDIPFLSLASPFNNAADQQYPQTVGLGNTIFRGSLTPNLGLLEVPPGVAGGLNPYQAMELVTKIHNNLTTRSNVFAVWLTVGFFAVTDTTTRPVKLGAEIGRADNKHIRHRMFAIIDRTNLAYEYSNPPNYSATGTAPGSIGVIPPPPVYITADAPPVGTTLANVFSVPGVSGFYEGIPWGTIQQPNPAPAAPPPAFPPPGWNPTTVGSTLLVDVGSNQELVQVIGITAGTPTTIWIDGNKTHSAPCRVIVPNTINATGKVVAGASSTVQVSALSGTFEGMPWSIQPGTNILVDCDGHTGVKEIVTVTAVNSSVSPPTLTATFSQAHGYGTNFVFPITYPCPAPGNPGPQQRYNPRSNPAVVRFFSIIN